MIFISLFILIVVAFCVDMSDISCTLLDCMMHDCLLLHDCMSFVYVGLTSIPYLQLSCRRLGVGSTTGYIDAREHSGGERHFDVDWSPIIEDLYSPELGFMDIVCDQKPPGMRGSACVEVIPPCMEAPRLFGGVQRVAYRWRDRTFVPRLDIPLWIRAEEEYFQDQDFYSQSGYSFVDQSRGQISSGFRYTRYGSAGCHGDQFTTAMASIQEALASLRQEIGGQQGRPPQFRMRRRMTHIPPPPPLPVPSVHQALPYYYTGILRSLHP
ncbi:hypothetical protein CK203_016256 [Vitis vinifera]|uniref:Uncharacterized protein n=1 Tax=Vitis vinifera TaxID=29760 RepID=A0A438JMU0_VITVI|nr:hypothetical protein CK203_016256 [Vitis vinifera]